MAHLPRQRKQQQVYKGIKNRVLSRWKKALSLSGYDFKNYEAVAINKVDQRPQCDLAQIRIEEYLGAFANLRKTSISFVMSVIY
jgi:hypothetical protein